MPHEPKQNTQGITVKRESLGGLRRVMWSVSTFGFVTSLLFSSSAFGIPYYVFDDYGGVWHDANQGQDSNTFCWAATAANILAWGNWGTSAHSTELDIFSSIQGHWTDEPGFTDNALRWWFDGTDPGGGLIDVPGGGNHWAGYDFDEYYHFNYVDESSMMVDLADWLNAGYGVGISTLGDSIIGHALNVWGYEYDPTSLNYYTGLYVTDNADLPGLTDLQFIPISYNEMFSRWELHDGVWTTGAYLDEVIALERRIVGVPEPTILSLLGIGLAGLVLTRRRLA